MTPSVPSDLDSQSLAVLGALRFCALAGLPMPTNDELGSVAGLVCHSAVRLRLRRLREAGAVRIVQDKVNRRAEFADLGAITPIRFSPRPKPVPETRPTWRDLVAACAQEIGLPVRIAGRKRTDNEGRLLNMTITRVGRATNWTSGMMAMKLDRCPSTVSYLARAADRRAAGDPAYAEQIQRICANLVEDKRLL